MIDLVPPGTPLAFMPTETDAAVLVAERWAGPQYLVTVIRGGRGGWIVYVQEEGT